MSTPSAVARQAPPVDRPGTLPAETQPVFTPAPPPVNWQDANSGYLGAAVAWVRHLLEREAAQVAAAGGDFSHPLPSQEEGQRDRSAFAATAFEAAAMRRAEAIEPPPALLILADRLGLSPFERSILLLCAAMAFDTRIAALCARAQDAPDRPYPTFALALAIFDGAAWDALSPEGPLRYWQLIEISQPGAQPLTVSALRADERIVNFIKGLNYLDDRLTGVLAPLGTGREAPLPPSQNEVAERIAGIIERGGADSRVPPVQLLGDDAAGKESVARAAAHRLGLDVYRLPAAAIPAQARELESLARLWQRESALMSLALYIDAGEAEPAPQTEGGPSSLTASVQRFAARSVGPVFVATRELLPDLGHAGSRIAVDVAKPLPHEQRAAWAQALDVAADGIPALLAGHFDLSAAALRGIAAGALAAPEGTDRPLADRLWDDCLVNTRPKLDLLAQRLKPLARWHDLVLPESELRLLHAIAAQVQHRSRVYDEWGFRERMNRGLGISALFAGESGTGKTMAAEVLANELRLNLYRIDLSAVVSKYIGETEKNLRRLFDAAEDGGAILFFDEADALFGKRSEVKDSHDRYANIEVNYLLQRMEAYRGLAILATNMKSALDTAFMRRLRFVVSFPFPGPAERRLIWEKAFPRQTPLDRLDYDRLARLNLTGGAIHNATLNAAFLAAAAGSSVTMALVLAAARDEYVKLERPVNEADFRWP